MNTIKFTITPEDLEIAQELGGSPSRSCVVTVAAKRQLKNIEASALGYIYGVGEGALFKYNKTLGDIMNLFDSHQFEKITLPLTVELTKENING